MSHLIEDSLFYAEISNGKESKSNVKKQNVQEMIEVKTQYQASTGQLELVWPQIFSQSPDSILAPTKPLPKTSSFIFKELVHVFQHDLIPIFHKLHLFQNISSPSLPQTLPIHQTPTQQSQDTSNETETILKYLYMSTIMESFDRDKETFRQIEDKAVRQKQNIIKIQNSIDKSFANISNELELYTNNTVKMAKKKIVNFGILDPDQKRQLEESLASQQPRGRFAHKHEFILNCIGILKIDSKKKFLGAGGSSNVFITKTKFQYVFSDDPQFWIDQNKTLTNNIIQKQFVIKQAKKGFQDKLRHENQIIKQMKGGFSIFLPKYYRIENSTSEAEMPRNDHFLIMDYLRGDSLDVYAENSSEVLSFWSKVFLMRRLVNGMRFIIGYKIVHLDLKPSNIIVVTDLLTKIIDFSEAYHPKICKQNYMPGISFPYACPQIFSKKPVHFDQKCDIFSLGVIMYELFLRRQIFQMSKEKMRQLYERQCYQSHILVSPEQFDSEELGPMFQIIFLLTMRCLDPRPEMRPTINWISIIITHVLTHFKGK